MIRRPTSDAGHLARRFVGSLRPGGPTLADDAWAEARLGPDERLLWRRMSGTDRRHAIEVARRATAALGERADPPVLAAALLHDVGKVVSGLGPARRVVATLMPGRYPHYRDYPQLGAELLARAGSDPLTVAWAAEHHLPADRWTVPAPVGAALQAADDG